MQGRIRTARQRLPACLLAAMLRLCATAGSTGAWPAGRTDDVVTVYTWYSDGGNLMMPEEWRTKEKQQAHAVQAEQSTEDKKPKYVTARAVARAALRRQPAAWRRSPVWQAELRTDFNDSATEQLQRGLISGGLFSTALFTLNRAYRLGAHTSPQLPCRLCRAAEETFFHLFYACEHSGYCDWRARFSDWGSPELLRCIWWGLVPLGCAYSEWMKEAAMAAASRRAAIAVRDQAEGGAQRMAERAYSCFRKAWGSAALRTGIG